MDVIAFVDNNALMWGSRLDNVEVKSPDFVLEADFDFVEIASMYAHVIHQQLVLKLNINEGRIRASERINRYPFLDDRTRGIAEDLLKNICEDLERNGVNAWLDFGTLLGAYRNNEVLPWDSDIDYGYLNEDYDKLYCVVDKLKTENHRNFRFEISEIELSDSNPQIVGSVIFPAAASRSNFSIEFVPYIQNSSKNLENAAVRNWIKPIPLQKVLPLRYVECDSNGFSKMMPSDTVSYLRNLYGDDWHVEKKNWTYLDYVKF